MKIMILNGSPKRDASDTMHMTRAFVEGMNETGENAVKTTKCNRRTTMKSLSTIQKLSQIGKILSKIIYICCIIGAVGCVVGLVCLPFADTGILKIGGVTIYGLIVNQAGIDLNSLYPLMTGAMIVCIGHVITAKFAERYFTHELTAGTPFTNDGAKELLHLGIISICVPLGAMILAQIISSIVAEFIGSGEAFKLEGGDSVAIGVMFIFMSLLCKYGAETTVVKVNCPCKKARCVRHGNCDACRAYHAESKRRRPCERYKRL